MQTLQLGICSAEDAGCPISEFSLSLDKYRSLVRYTNRRLIQYQEKMGAFIPSLFRDRKVVDSACKKCYWPLEGSSHYCTILKKDFWGFFWTLLSGRVA